jgi:hypothetical protein
MFTFTAPFVFHHKVQNHQNIKNKVLPSILRSYQFNQNNSQYKWAKDSTSNVRTSYDVDDRSFYDEEFYRSIIWNPLNELYASVPQLKPKEQMIDSVWWNVYQRGGDAEIHNHGEEYYSISGLYVLESNELNKTVFVFDTMFDYQEQTTEYVMEGDVLLFPTSLLHYVLPAERQRVTVSFNVASLLNDRQEENLERAIQTIRKLKQLSFPQVAEKVVEKV